MNKLYLKIEVIFKLIYITMENTLEEIKRSYTSLQMNLFLEYYIKADYKESKHLQQVLDSTKFNIMFGNREYIFRKDYIEWWFQTSNIKDKELNMWIIGEMAIMHSCPYIISRFKELLDCEPIFRNFVTNLFKEKRYDYEVFYSIIALIRSISIHWSLANNYKLKDWDFSKWKDHHIKKGIDKLEFHLNIVDKLHKLDVYIDINKIVIWYNFTEIFDGYQMLMLIELCMNVTTAFIIAQSK